METKLEKKPSNIFTKLINARKDIREMKLAKAGKNTFSNYEYFTPEQVSQAVAIVCEKNALATIFNMERRENGLVGTLLLVDADNPEHEIEFTMPTEMPIIKATNTAQQIGGAMTYTERYLKMAAFNIADNSLDFDATNKDNSNSATVPTKPKTEIVYAEHGDKRQLKSGDHLLIGGTDYIFVTGTTSGKTWYKLEDPAQKDPGTNYNKSYWSSSDTFKQLIYQWEESCNNVVDPDSIPENLGE